MADNKNVSTQGNNSSASIATTVAAVAGGASPSVVNRLLEILEAQENDRRAEIELRKRKEAEKKAQDLSIRDQNIRDFANKEREEKMKQAACRHRVGAAGNFGTALAGWTLVSGNLHLVCQECGKDFKSREEIADVNRQGLMPAAEAIAGAPRA